MRAKYFLKGMGIGVTVTALIFTIAFALNPPTLSDDEVIARAKVLGMVESDEMEEEQDAMASGEATESEETGESAETGEVTGEQETTESEETSDAAPEDKTSESTGDDEKKSEKNTDKKSDDNTDEKTADNEGYKTTDTVGDTSEAAETPGDTVEFSVHSGEDSSAVAARLHKAGIISDPTDFDTYLSTNGYDTRIHPGTYNIPAGSSYEAIARAIAY